MNSRRILTLATLCLGLALPFGALGQETPDELQIVAPLPEQPQPRANATTAQAAEPIAIGLAGNRMVRASNRRVAVQGGGAFAQSGQVPVGRLAVSRSGVATQAALGLRDLEVVAEIEGLCARTTVKHVFQNDTDALLEGVFTFGLPCDAAVDRFAMTIQSETDLMEGSLVDATVATNTYSTLVYGQGIDPGKLEWLGDNLFRATIFPIPPKLTKTIVVSYLQPLTPRLNYDGSRELLYHYPLAATMEALPPALNFRFAARLEGLARDAAVRSSIGKVAQGLDGARLISAAYDAKTALDVCDWTIAVKTERPAKEQAGNCWLQAHRSDALKPGQFALTVCPEAGPPAPPQPLDVVFLVDTSASRTLKHMENATLFMEAVLNQLRPDDRFAVMAFDIEPRAWSGGLTAPTAESIRKAVEFLHGIRPLGATDVVGAFQAMKKNFASESQRPLRIVFIGDTLATYGSKDVEAGVNDVLAGLKAELHPVYTAARKNAAAEENAEVEGLARVFGAPVIRLSHNTGLAVAAAELSTRLADRYLRHAKIEVQSVDSGALSLLGGDVGGVPINAGTTWFGTYLQPGAALVTLSGLIAGREYKQTWSVALPAIEKANAPVEKLWARAQIAQLLADGDKRAAELAKEHGVLSRGTAFLVLESEDMYRNFQIKRSSGDMLADHDLRAKFLAGTRVLQIQEADEVAQPQEALTIDAASGIRLGGGHALGTSRKQALEFGGVWVDVSLQSVQVAEKQGKDVLTKQACVERRLALSRLIAVERCLPFEPEVVFASHWLQALPLTLHGDGTNLTKLFDPCSDAEIWKIVDAQAVKAPDTWRISARNAQGGWVNSGGVQPSFAQVQLTDSEAQLDALVSNEKRSAVKVSAEVLQVESHLLAHQILGALLTGRDPGHFKASGPRDVIRICQTRRVLAYSLAKVPADRVAAAFLFLAELTVAEHQSELAETLVARALEAAPAANHAKPAALAFLIKALGQQVRADFAAAAESYQDVLKTPKALVHTGRDLMYRSLVTAMAVGGNLPGATLALERWCAEDHYNKDIAKQLGKAYLQAGRKADAIRALSTAAEFSPEFGANYATPESFLQMLENK